MAEVETTGKWAGIFAELGIDVGDGRHKACPVCGGKDRFRFDDREGKGTWICNNCGAGNGFELVKLILDTDFAGALKAVSQVVEKVPVAAVIEREGTITREYFRKILQESERASSKNLIGRYLANRGINTIPRCLRLHPGLKEPDTGTTYPCMLAIVTLPDDTAVTVHRTWLVEPGNKAPVAKPKKLLPGLKKITGGAIRLWPMPESGIIGIAEGIETALACKIIYNTVTWAAVNANMLESFVPPIGVKQVVVFGDNDKTYTGQRAAYRLANRLVVERGMVVDVDIPEIEGDFNDVLITGVGDGPVDSSAMLALRAQT